MNAIFLVITLGSLEALPPHSAGLAERPRSMPPIVAARAPSVLVAQQRQVQWPKLDPRDPQRPASGAVSASSQQRSTQTSAAPSIGRSQLTKEPPSYDDSAPSRPAGRLVTPEAPSEETTPLPATSSRQSGSRFRDEQLLPAAEKPRFSDRDFGAPVASQPESSDTGFSAPSTFRTSVRKQSGGRELAPNPFEFRPASASDDPDELERAAPYKSFAIGASDRENDLGMYGAEPYSEPLGGKRGDERLASGRQEPRDTRLTNGEGDDSTLQGGRTVPENASNSMWSFAIVILLLCASMGANVYLAWVAREFYERYRSLAQQVRAARNNLA